MADISKIKDLSGTTYDLKDAAARTSITQLSGQVAGALLFDTVCTMSGTVASFTAHVYSGGTDVTQNYAAACFTWYKRTATGMTQYQTTGPAFSVNTNTLGYGGTVVARFDSEGGST